MAKLTDRNALTTPADGDFYVTTDVSDTTDAPTGTDKKITWANIKATLKTYFDTLYAAVSHTHTESEITDLGSYIGTAGVTYENLDANGDVGTGAGQLAIGNHTHTGVYQPYDANLPTWPATVDATEVGYLNGVTSAIQTQLDAKLASSSYDDATAAETDTGTSTAKYVSPDGLAGSYAGTKNVAVQVFEGATDTATGDGKAYFMIPAELAGMNLVDVKAGVAAAGTTGTTDIQIHNVTQAADMLTTKLTIDSAETTSETAATAAVIDTANDDVAEGDVIRIDVDAVSTTPATGLFVTLAFRLP